jgi:hypothetical protein
MIARLDIKQWLLAIAPESRTKPETMPVDELGASARKGLMRRV